MDKDFSVAVPCSCGEHFIKVTVSNDDEKLVYLSFFTSEYISKQSKYGYFSRIIRAAKVLLGLDLEIYDVVLSANDASVLGDLLKDNIE